MSGPRHRAVFFDLDGTLTDPKLGITRSIQHAMRKRGLEAPHADALEDWIGPPLEASFRTKLDVDAATARQMLADYREYFAERGLYENAVYDGIPELLTRLVADGCRLVLATSKPGVYAQRILEHFDLAGHFHAVVGSHLDGRRVEKREIVRDALVEAGCAPGLCVMVGDREHDVRGARANGVRAITADWGYGSEEELARARPAHRAESVEALGRLLFEGTQLLVELP